MEVAIGVGAILACMAASIAICNLIDAVYRKYK